MELIVENAAVGHETLMLYDNSMCYVFLYQLWLFFIGVQLYGVTDFHRLDISYVRRMIMTLDVNGYSSQFNNFVNFATQQIQTGGAKGRTSIAQLDAETTLGDRTIKANSRDTVGKWFRSRTLKDTNNMTREIFRNAVADMFGGKDNIPKSVLDAMKIKDYDKGKPLTARRIMAVKEAIDLDGTAKINAKLGKNFDIAKAETCALSQGWSQGELGKITHVAKLLCAAENIDEETAIARLSTPGSKENRLMNYGGRFLDSVSNFTNGLRLMDSFADWFKNICDTMKPVAKMMHKDRDYSPADTFTKLNFSTLLLDPDNGKGFEKFAFEELSINPKANLAETDMEKLFGFKNNKAMNFMGQYYGNSFYSSIANVPKEKRNVIYSALTAFNQPVKNAGEAKQKHSDATLRTWISHQNAPVFIARLLKNFDKAESMYQAGTLTPKNIIKEFFNEIPDKGNYDYKTINDYFQKIDNDLSLDEDEGGKYYDLNGVVLAMQNSGATFEETVSALRNGTALPVPQYLSTGTIDLPSFDGTTSGGRKLLEGDLMRPDFCYNQNGNRLLKPDPNGGFGFTFPGENRFYTNGSQQGQNNIQRVCDKVAELCGPVHAIQANSVMMMLSQSGLSNIRGGIPQFKVNCNEHAPVEYSITKDQQTGAVTIKYSSPEALPFKFEWTSTVDLNGNVTTTPMTAEWKQPQ